MKKLVTLFVSAAFSVCLPFFLQAQEESRFLSYQVRLDVQAIDPERLQEEILAFLKTSKGYFTYRDSAAMQVKILPEKILPFIELVKQKGMVIGQDISNFNYQQDYQRAQITIKTQEETLDTILKLFDQAGLYEALEIERKIREMISEIEQARGKTRLIEERVRYAYVTLSFKSYQAEKERPNTCPFPWIRDLSLYRIFQP